MSNTKGDAKADVHFVRPKDGETEAEFADRMAGPMIEAINADRKKRGLPPLPKV